MIFRSIGLGLIETIRLRKLIFLFWSVNLLLSLIFLFPYLSAFNRFFSERIVSRLLNQVNVFTYYSEFFHYFAQPLHLSRNSLLMGRLLILIISVILSGGVISTFLQDDKVNWKKFRLECRRFLGRMLRLGLLQLFIVILFLAVSILCYLPVNYFLPSFFIEDIYFYSFISWAGFAILFILIAFLLFDLTRIWLVQQNAPSILTALRAAAVCFWRNPFRIYLVYFLQALLWTAVVMIYWVLQSGLRNNSVITILLEFAILQFFIWIQYWTRLSRFSALIRISGIDENQKMASNHEWR